MKRMDAVNGHWVGGLGEGWENALAFDLRMGGVGNDASGVCLDSTARLSAWTRQPDCMTFLHACKTYRSKALQTAHTIFDDNDLTSNGIENSIAPPRKLKLYSYVSRCRVSPATGLSLELDANPWH